MKTKRNSNELKNSEAGPRPASCRLAVPTEDLLGTGQHTVTNNLVWRLGWVSAGAGELTAGGSWSSGRGVIDASAAAQLEPSPCHTLTFTQFPAHNKLFHATGSSLPMFPLF